MRAIDVYSIELKEVDPEFFVTVETADSQCIISVPHSGVLIPEEFMDNYDIGREMLINTDLHTNIIFESDYGVTITFALNNYFTNVGRFRNPPQDADLPAHLKRSPLYGRSLLGRELIKQHYDKKTEERILEHYDHYHKALAHAIRKQKDENGYALIFDCHSYNSKALPDAPDAGQPRADFNIGTLEDTSANQEIIDAYTQALQEACDEHKWTVKKNWPYKGGFITQQYHDPENDVHVIQLEVKKSLYMNEGLGKPVHTDFHLRKKSAEKVKAAIQAAQRAAIKKAQELYA